MKTGDSAAVSVASPALRDLPGEAWGGLAAMLVALPSSIAFGVLIFAPLGGEYIAAGAMAGVVGAVALGLVCPLFGDTGGLISSPSAPAAAIMAGLAAGLVKPGRVAPAEAIVLLTIVGLGCGLLQVALGALGAGRLMKYIPFPVASGYLSAVGVQVIVGQLPKFFAWPKGLGLWAGLTTPSAWQPAAVAVGLVTMAVMVAAPKLTRKVPAPILGVAAGFAAYFTLARGRPAMASLDGNPLVIGRLPIAGGAFWSSLAERAAALRRFRPADLELVAMPSLLLAVLLSVDTLKTCVQVDAMTERRHDSNRELRAQGLGNVVSALLGGAPGSGGTGVTLVNLASGGKTRVSGVLDGVFCLVAAAALSRWIAWLPIASLAGILLIVGWRMIDRTGLKLMTHRSTALDFVVIAAVVATALAAGLMTAAGVGVLMCFLLFVRDQMRGSVIRSKIYGDRDFSKQRRLPHEMRVLEKLGRRTVVVELQGSLFFGTTDQLFTELEPELKGDKFVVLDMRRVQSVDFTGARMLEQIERRLESKGGKLLFAGLPTNTPTGMDLNAYFADLGVVGPKSGQVFPEVSDAMEWCEDRILDEAGLAQVSGPPVELAEIELVRGFSADLLDGLRRCLTTASYQAGQVIFRFGETGDELYLVRRGAVRIMLPLDGGGRHHVATYRRRDFFGEVAFLDRGTRTADAVAATPTDLYVLSRLKFDELAPKTPDLGRLVFYRLAREIAFRLRRTDREVQALEQA